MSRAGVSLMKLSAPHQRCEQCGPDVSLHYETHEVVYRVEWARFRVATCEGRALTVMVEAIERGGVPDQELEPAIAAQLEKLETYVSQLEIENESMTREIAETHVALGQMDAAIDALCTRH